MFPTSSLNWTLFLTKSEYGLIMQILLVIGTPESYWIKEYIKGNASSVLWFMV